MPETLSLVREMAFFILGMLIFTLGILVGVGVGVFLSWLYVSWIDETLG